MIAWVLTPLLPTLCLSVWCVQGELRDINEASRSWVRSAMSTCRWRRPRPSWWYCTKPWQSSPVWCHKSEVSVCRALKEASRYVCIEVDWWVLNYSWFVLWWLSSVHLERNLNPKAACLNKHEEEKFLRLSSPFAGLLDMTTGRPSDISSDSMTITPPPLTPISSAFPRHRGRDESNGVFYTRGGLGGHNTLQAQASTPSTSHSRYLWCVC